MAKKQGLKERQIVHNTCIIKGCGAKAKAVLYVPDKGKRGMRWQCENGHLEYTRKYTVERKY